MRWLPLLLLPFVLTACTTQRKAKEDAHRAFIAGQQEALRRLHQAPTANAVTINGPVRHPQVAWTPGLTLSQAIIAAEYFAEKDPVEILLVRGGLAYRYEPGQLLSGRDVPVEAGDVIQLNLQPSAPAPR
jgi:hypothetical protein